VGIVININRVDIGVPTPPCSPFRWASWCRRKAAGLLRRACPIMVKYKRKEEVCSRLLKNLVATGLLTNIQLKIKKILEMMCFLIY